MASPMVAPVLPMSQGKVHLVPCAKFAVHFSVAKITAIFAMSCKFVFSCCKHFLVAQCHAAWPQVTSWKGVDLRIRGKNAWSQDTSLVNR